jgi:hypothetical protein
MDNKESINPMIASDGDTFRVSAALTAAIARTVQPFVREVSA